LRAAGAGRYNNRFMALRIVLIGQAAFGEKTLERLAREQEIVAVYCPPDMPGVKPDPLKAAADAMGIPVHQPKSMKSEEVHRTFAEHRADLGVLAFVTVIVPQRIIELPRLGTICFHPSLLPRYRGGSAINWQIIRGETRGGLTVFWTDAGIDTGPILLQKEVEIGPDDTTGTVYFEKIFPLGLDAMEEAVRLIAQGCAPRIVQDESSATYDPLCRDSHVAIEWSQPARQVYDLIRGADPQPGAWAIHRGEKARFYDCRLGERSDAEPGRVLAIGEQGAEVALDGARLLVRRLRLGESPRKLPPSDLAREGRIAAGDLLQPGAVDGG
jgi:methionyl-tRNA formyltransferase